MAGKLSHNTMNCIVTGGWLGWQGVSRYSRVYHDKGAGDMARHCIAIQGHDTA